MKIDDDDDDVVDGGAGIYPCQGCDLWDLDDESSCGA